MVFQSRTRPKPNKPITMWASEGNRTIENLSGNELLAVFDNAAVVLILVDENGQVLRINKSGSQMVGIQSEEAAGLFAGEVLKCINLHSEPNAVCGQMKQCATCDVRQTFSDTFMNGKDYLKKEGNFRMVLNGKHVHRNILISSSKIHINSNEYVLLTIDDITKLREQEHELSRLITTRDKLYSIIAHDLRGSLSTIIGFIDLIIYKLQDLNPVELKEFLESVQQSGHEAYTLLENLFDWTSLQWSNRFYNPKETSLQDILAQTIETCTPFASRKEINLKYKLKYSGAWDLDKGMIITVLRNLVNNAIKFTNRGGTVELIVEADNHTLTFTVADSGIGIKPEKLPVIFDFEHGNQTNGTEEERGTGLGLMICKEFVESHQGKIWVESTPGKGSTFYITLPQMEIG
jgi:two-component system, sensor histidine kinase and response regulator